MKTIEAVIVMWVVLLAGTVVLPSKVLAQQGDGSSSAQYVFLIDDSEAMGSAVASGDAIDPDRLAVFSTRAILNLLDDDDEVTVAGLSEAASGERIPGLRRASENRNQLESTLSEDGDLAAYGGRSAACAEALAAVGEQLERAHRPGTSQYVVFLTPGRCDGAQVDVDGWLSGLSSHEEGRLQFSLLEWPSEHDPSPDLIELVERSGGMHAAVSVDNPAELFEPFAEVLSRSRGGQALLLDAGQNVVPAHSKARRVDLIAIAPDQEEELSLGLAPLGEEGQVEPVGQPQAGRHQFEEGLPFRFAASSYEPLDGPIEIEVGGAGTMQRVEITRRAIVIDEAVHFEYDRATIQEESHDLLDEIAQVLVDAPRIRKLEIQGHTDHAGSADYNVQLSGQRAESVREYLIERGVEANRLSSEGYGFSEPIVPVAPGEQESEQAAAQNRRVDFVILEQDEASEDESPDGDWAVVAVPDYRLQMGMDVTLGDCSEEGAPTSFVPEDESVCVRAELLNHRGERVTYDLAGPSTRAEVVHRRPDGETEHMEMSRDGNAPVFYGDMSEMELGDHILRPEIRLVSASRPDVVLRGEARTIQSSSRRVSAEPGAIELGDIYPGTEHYESFELEGNFPTAPGRLKVDGRDEVRDCLRVELSGVEEGASQPLTSGQSYTVAALVAPNCAPESFEDDIDTDLVIQFETEAGEQPIPELRLPFSATLTQEMEIAEAPVEAAMVAGEKSEIPLTVRSNHRQDLDLQIVLPEDDEHGAWPDRGDHLKLVSEAHEVTIPPTREGEEPTALVPLEVRSDACCEGGTYQTQVALLPSHDGASPIVVDVELVVEDASWWACWGPRVMLALLLLLLALLLLYLISIYRSSHFIKRDRLAASLTPMEWDDFGEAHPDTSHRAQVRQMVDRQMGFVERLKAWLKANPLVIGLPGHDYYETVELLLDPSIHINRTRLRLQGTRDHLSDLRDNPRRGVGRCFATARGGLTFFVVEDQQGRIGAFEIEDPFDGFGGDEGFEPEPDVLGRRTELLVANGDREGGSFAGWRVGG